MTFIALWAVIWYMYQIRYIKIIFILPFVSGRIDKGPVEYFSSILIDNIYTRVIPTVSISFGLAYLIEKLKFLF